MCGKRLRTVLLLLVLPFLALSPLSSEEVYEITEAELTQLENNLEELRIHNEELTNNLETARIALRESTQELLGLRTETGRLRVNLTRAHEELTRAQSSLMKAQNSFDEYESATKRRNVRNVIVSFIIGAVTGGAIGVIFI